MAETLMTEHSVFTAKSIKSLGTSLKKKESEKKNEIKTEDKGFLSTTNENMEDLYLEILNAEELKNLVQFMRKKQSNFKKEIKVLFDQNEKTNSLLKQREELDEIEKKDMKQLKNSYREKTKELMDLKNINQKNKQCEIPFEGQCSNKLKNKTPDNSPISLDSSHEMKNFSKKWLRDEAFFNYNSTDWQFLFKNMEIQTKTMIKHINVEITNISSFLISFEDIGIVSESKEI